MARGIWNRAANDVVVSTLRLGLYIIGRKACLQGVHRRSLINLVEVIIVKQSWAGRQVAKQEVAYVFPDEDQLARIK